ncbi:hypothetical protein FRX31_011310 [Thalictrum thalictroides]|uniref:AP2/ERF domain-containing protein n=1 Tax=Thalictrum thalictroides TaxID=46969 RepID=A0A7J6WQ61_THATH|nr:hypothetical protein FRX31_011310 [Thalictrum thalictroides]
MGRRPAKKRVARQARRRRSFWGGFVAQIHNPIIKRNQYLGRYATAEEAARLHDAKAREFYGFRPNTNFNLSESSNIFYHRKNNILEIRHAVDAAYSHPICMFLDSIDKFLMPMLGSRLNDVAGVGSSAGSSSTTAMPQRGLDIDLNLPPPPEI